MLFDGADFVGVGDCRLLDVGPTEPVAAGVSDPVYTLVPRPPPSAELTGTEDVVGGPAWPAV